MIVYEATRAEFTDDVLSNTIETRILQSFQQRLGHSTSRAEVEAWRNSMGYMNNALLGAACRLPQRWRAESLIVNINRFIKDREEA